VIKRLPQQGVTVMIIEHTMHAMLKICDQLVVLDHGVVIASGLPMDVISDPVVGRSLSRQENGWRNMLRLEGVSAAYGNIQALRGRDPRGHRRADGRRSSARTARGSRRCSR
jgi:ABC-type branched-subunit amino acid transport system ATPase component